MRIKIPGITQYIRKILSKYPHSKPLQITRLLWNQVGKDYFPNERSFYLRYRNFIKTEKWAFKRWLQTKENTNLLARPLKGLKFPLSGSHRIEYSLERPISQVYLELIKKEAIKRRPGVRDDKPINSWYVIPNRNRMMEFHNKFITIRAFPVSGSVRILPAFPMPRAHLKIHVENALFYAGIDLRDIQEITKKMIPSSRHRTFYVGRISPFKIEFYKESLGLIISSDGSHPRHLETEESYPPWIFEIIRSNEGISSSLLEFANQIKVHLSVLRGIQESTKDLNKTIKILNEVLSSYTHNDA